LGIVSGSGAGSTVVLADLPSVRALLLRDSPSAFKDKNIFAFDSILDVV
jgi:hypothetical protein